MLLTSLPKVDPPAELWERDGEGCWMGAMSRSLSFVMIRGEAWPDDTRDLSVWRGKEPSNLLLDVEFAP